MRRLFFSLLLLLTLLPSCGKIPDVHPFAKATTDMGESINTSLKQVATDLEKTDQIRTLNPDQKQRLQNYQKQLKERSDDFTKVAHAFDSYAKALDNIATAGEKRADRIEKVSKATDELIEASKKFAAGFTAPYAAVITPVLNTLTEAVNKLNAAYTTNKLAKLASPEQERVIQSTAQLLSAGMAQFAKIDSSAYNLLLYNDATHRDIKRYYTQARKRQQAVTAMLSSITESQAILLGDARYYDNLSNNESGPIDYVRKNDQDLQQSVTTAYRRFSTAATPANKLRLVAALQQREQFYLALSELPQSLYDAEQARWNTAYVVPQQQSYALLQKSQQLIKTWASSHYELRQLLMKAQHVSRQDILTEAQNIQKLIAELKEAREKAAGTKKDSQEAQNTADAEVATN